MTQQGNQLLKKEAIKAVEELVSFNKKVAIYCYNLERSFVENVKEISGTGWTAEEAKKRYGL